MMKGKVRSRIIDRKKRIHCKNTMCTMLYILHKMYTRLNVLFLLLYIDILGLPINGKIFLSR